MALFSFLKGRGDARSAASNASGAQPVSAANLDAVRARARRRLIGAAVLVSAAVVGLPMIFESKPRALPSDTPIDVARSDGLPAVSVPTAKTMSPTMPTLPLPAVVEAVPPPQREDVKPRKSAPADKFSGKAEKAEKGVVTESAGEAGREIPPSAVTTLPPIPDVAPTVKPPKAPKVADDRPVARKESSPAAAAPERKPASKPESKVDAERKVAPKVDKVDKADRVDKSDKTDQADKAGRPDKGDKADRLDKAARAEKVDEAAKARAKEHAKKAEHAREAARAKALLEGHEEATDKSAKSASPTKTAKSESAAGTKGAGSGKFVVQVGAFGQSSSAEAAQAKAEKLGFKAHSQTVETSGGTRTRVRIGPFASREEADRAAERLRAGGQGAAVFPQ